MYSFLTPRLLTACLLSGLLYGQGAPPAVSIVAYNYVGQQQVSGSKYNVSYQGILVNFGPTLTDVKASLTSLSPASFTVVPGQGTLDFSPVPEGGVVTSNNTFTILVDTSVAFDFGQLGWTYTTGSAAPPPVANAGPNQTVPLGSTVTLDGSGSTNPSGVGTLTYSWAFTSKPNGSNATLSNSNSVMPTFVVDVPGNYVAALTVSNGAASGTASVTISTQALPPVANAGPNQVAHVGSTVTLNGSGSTNPSGFGTLTYSWAFASKPAGSGAALTNPTSVMPTFVVDVSGNYVITLTVNNGAGSNSASTTVSTNGVAPVANAGPGQTISVGSTVHLNGSGSTDANGNPLSYSWSLITVPAGSTATLTNSNTAFPTFVADRIGIYVAQLVVNNTFQNSAPATVNINTTDTAPVANAGPAQRVDVGTVVQLDGSGSTDVDGNPLTYSWSLIRVPSGSTAALNNPAIVNPTFTADLPGMYVAQLIVNDGFLNSLAATVTISTNTVPPTANAGSNQTVAHGTVVQLDGSASKDAQGLPLTFQWSLLNRPLGSSASLSNSTSVNPAFTADKPGQYIAQLIVNNGVLNSAPSTVTITTTNTPPVANAGPNQSNLNVGATVALDGSGSSDADHDPLTYSWSLLSVPPSSLATLAAPTSVSPAFVADQPGMYVAQLIVSDGFVNSQPSTVTISVNTPQPPTANAGSNQAAPHGSKVTLNGSGSDPLNLPLTFNWTLITVPNLSTAALSNPNSATPSLTADRPGLYVAQLVVNNGFVNSAPATVSVAAINIPPIAKAGPAQSVVVGSTVTLDGSGSSDADKDPLTYSWVFTAMPEGSSAVLIGAKTKSPSFVGDVIGTYGAQLTVNDGFVNSFPSFVTITVHDVEPPTANAGPNQSVGHNVTVSLNGSGTDPQSYPLTYQWTLINKPTGSAAVLSNGAIANPTFFADKVGSYVAQLITNNGKKSSTPSIVTITAANTVPVANAGPRQNVKADVSTVVTLNGSGSSDADHDSLTYAWSLVSKPVGSAAVILGATTITPQFGPIDKEGKYVVQLIVNDGTADSAPSFITVTAASSIRIVLTPNPLDMTTSSPGTLTVTVPFPADDGGQAVLLSMFDGTVISVPQMVLIPAGATSVNVTVTGVAAGSTNILATAPPLQPGPGVIKVTSASLEFSQNPLSVGVTRTISSTVVLSAPAPAGGVVVAFTSSDTSKVTVVPTITIPSGAFSGSFSVNGIALGQASITASAPGYGTASTTVTVAPVGHVNLPSSLTVGATPIPFPISLASAAPLGGVTITLTSSDPSTVALSSSTVVIPQQAVTPSAPVMVSGLKLGSATISATASGLSVDPPTSVQVTGSLSFASSTLSINGSVTQNIALKLSVAAPPAGLIVNLSSDQPGVASLPPSVTIPGNQTSVNVPVTGNSGGITNITASANLASVSGATLSVTVQVFGPIILPGSTNPGLGQSAPFNVSLPSPAPAGGVTITFVSDSPGVATITPSTVTIPFNATVPSIQPSVFGVSTGTAHINATGPPFLPATASVSVTATVSFSMNLTLLAGAAQSLTLNLPAITPTALTISLVSSAPAIASVPASVTFLAKTKSVTVPVNGVSPGTANITASAPNVNSATAAITVNTPLTITTTSLPNGTAKSAYFTIVSSIGGVPAFTWSAVGLPTGLSIDPLSGAISGTPATAGTSIVTVTITDSSTPAAQTASVNLALTII